MQQKTAPTNLQLILVHLQCIDDLIIEDKTPYRFKAKEINNQMRKYVHNICKNMEASCNEDELELLDKCRELYWEVDKVIKEKYLG